MVRPRLFNFVLLTAACSPGSVSGPYDQGQRTTNVAPPVDDGDAVTPTGDSGAATADDDHPVSDIDPGDGSRVVDPGDAIDGRETLGPAYQDVGLTTRDVPHGAVYHLTMLSQDSTFYPGLNGSYMRHVDVYVPADYHDGDAAPFIVVQDGTGYTDRLRSALDNLIADVKVPKVVAIMVDSGGGDGIGSERGLEYDTMSDVYQRFIDGEVLPAVRAALATDYPHMGLTDDPEGRATMGCSSGAAAAFTMAWFGSDRYRRVLSYSGTYVDQQDPAVLTYPHGAWEYHEHLIAESASRPLRVYLEVGENDAGYANDEASLHNWVLANQRMADALEAKGYHDRFEFALGAGHCDGRVIGQTLSLALIWLWAGYPVD